MMRLKQIVDRKVACYRSRISWSARTTKASCQCGQHDSNPLLLRPKLTGKKPVFLPPRHQFEQDSFEVFGFGNGGENRMIDRLLEPPEFSRRAACIDQRVRDRL